MGFFGRRKTKSAEIKSQDLMDASSSNEDSTPPVLQMPSPPRVSKKIAKSNVEPSLDRVPQLIQDIQTCDSGDKPARALRMLFSLSELPSDNRTKMIETNLVPTLLDFLQATERGSSEQYLTLLVLNNISIPAQNKRSIVLEHNGGAILAKLLCEDPSCHLLAIILVNLSFCDTQLRADLAFLVPSIAYALKLSSLTPNDFEVYDEEGDTVEDKLKHLLMKEEKARPSSNGNSNHNINAAEMILSPEDFVYPETARWCMAALKNLTRPPSTKGSVNVLESGIVPLIMRIIAIGGPVTSSLTTDGSLVRIYNSQRDNSLNPVGSTCAWDSNSIQDAALFVIMHLSAAQPDQVLQLGGVHQLPLIADSAAVDGDKNEEVCQVQFQSMKARMALSYLAGSSGHFGQPRGKNTTATFTHSEDSVLLVSDSEACLLVELLANTLHNRAKEGPGGYSASTFHVKSVVFSIRCLLTHMANQAQFFSACGVRLNALLMKALAEHSVKQSTLLDAEAAEYAAFSLYLQSNYGFKTRFLPAVYGNDDKINGTGSLAAKILTSYIHVKDITPAGHHASEQLLLRLRYLQFKGSVGELASGMTTEGDYFLDSDLLKKAECIVVEKRSHGARPNAGIFDRPILRSRAPKNGSRSPWESRAVRVFPSALVAVQELSFGSSRVRHMDAIDDIMIANNIANSANGDKTESYHYWWSWEDAASEIQRNLERIRSTDSATNSLFSGAASRRTRTSIAKDSGGPVSIFGLSCCAVDNTLSH